MKMTMEEIRNKKNKLFEMIMIEKKKGNEPSKELVKEYRKAQKQHKKIARELYY